MRRLRVLALVWVVLLAASHVWRLVHEPAFTPAPGEHVVEVSAVDGALRLDRGVRLVYADSAPGDTARPVVLLLHGSPGSRRDFVGIVRASRPGLRLIAPDLPGFGRSERDVPDYSARAHADYAIQLLDRLAIDRAHVVGFSMGGAVAAYLADAAPGRVSSLTLLAATGVQELELLGSHPLNRAVHAVQLAALWSVREGVPHFGALDGAFLGVPYARNFYDTDQRPLRGMLARVRVPVLIVHGARDPLVPVAAAREHHRIVPHSELVVGERDSHFLPFVRAPWVASRIESFVERVERGAAPTRERADPARLAAAARPFDPSVVPPARGVTLLVLVGLIVVATWVSEDLTCVGVGLMVAEGRIGFVPGTLACFLGIWVGDLALYLGGRWFGRPLVDRVPLRWLIRPERLETSARWFERRGPAVIASSRFLPGTRLPTYVIAGVLRAPFWQFNLWFALAAVVWTPLLVAFAAVTGAGVLRVLESLGARFVWAGLLAVAVLVAVVRVVELMLTARGRARLIARWRRLTHWEFWPRWALYPPVVAWIVWLGVRHRGPTVFTAANPGMPAGGFVGESKADILEALERAGAPVARFRRLPASGTVAERVATAEAFRAEHGLDWPVVVKPDVGERGSGVAVVRSSEDLRSALERVPGDALVQEYVEGPELGVFWYRLPGEPRGTVFSITDKRLPELTGDGVRSLAQLIRDDPRAAILHETYARELGDRVDEIPAQGERVRLVEVGTHCRGALFLDGAWARTPELERRVDEFSRAWDGFFFGRYDLRAPSAEALREGRDLRILELNGVTSESTHIYDPKHGVLDAWRILFRQWELAFEIGARNRDRGVRPAGLGELVALLCAGRGTGQSR